MRDYKGWVESRNFTVHDLIATNNNNNPRFCRNNAEEMIKKIKVKKIYLQVEISLIRRTSLGLQRAAADLRSGGRSLESGVQA